MAITSFAEDMPTNKKWLKEELSRLKNSTLVLVVIVFSALGVLIGYYFLSGVFVDPFKNVTYAAFDGSSLRISWETEFPAKTQVEYGTSGIYVNETQPTADYETVHNADLKGLLPDKSHMFRLVAEDTTGQKHISLFYKAE